MPDGTTALPVGKGAELAGTLTALEPPLTGTTGTTDGTVWPGVTVTYEMTVETDGQVVGQTGQALLWVTGELATVLVEPTAPPVGVPGTRGMTMVVLWLGLLLTGTTTVVEADGVLLVTGMTTTVLEVPAVPMGTVTVVELALELTEATLDEAVAVAEELTGQTVTPTVMMLVTTAVVIWLAGQL